ncbi:unnamed protein product [Camellia sinensis]
MEAGRNFFTSSPPVPPRTHLKNSPSYSSSDNKKLMLPVTFAVLMLHEQASRALPFMPTSSLARHFPTSVLLQEQRDENRPFLHIMKEDKISQVTLDSRRMESGSSEHEENINIDSDQRLKDFQRQMLNLPGLRLQFLLREEITSLTMLSVSSKAKKLMLDIEPHNVVALAKKALSASKKAALLAEDSQLFEADVDECLTPSSRSTSFDNFPPEEKTVRSTRLLERRSKRRRVTKLNVVVHERRAELQRKTSEAFDPNDPLRLFLRSAETKQLLTVEEESDLIAQIQDLMRLEEVKSRLLSQFDREPTLIEWAAAVGLSCQRLKMRLHCGHSSRERLIYANFRMVVHIAKQYQGRGLNLQDLLQEGSRGLMRSVEKFKPQGGCRFASYAYWWIRQSIRKAIFHHSRTIRLPYLEDSLLKKILNWLSLTQNKSMLQDNVYNLLYKVMEAKRSCIGEGNHQPTKEEIAVRIGMTIDKLELLLHSARMPLSMQQPVWADQNTTFQEITADTSIEIPDLSVEKQLMRQHVRNVLSILSPKERKIVRLRYGIDGDKPKTLSAIGDVFGLSKERVRQLETRALHKLRQSLSSQGLEAYANLII